MLMFQSQNSEDRWIHKNWSKLKLPRRGVFVEVGAGNGCHLSNTYYLEKVRGWSGLLIEPDQRHKIISRPKSKIERCAIGPRGTISLGLTEDPHCSGELRQEGAQDRGLNLVGKLEVEQYPLSEILEKHKIKQIDLISIDTEGTELEVWSTLDQTRWKPTIVIMEINTWGLPDRKDEVVSVLTGQDYSLIHMTRLNGIFISTR